MDRQLLNPDFPVWDLTSARAWCLALARRHYENFPVASFLIPAHLRADLAVVYAFARIADDIADEPGLSSEERLRLLGDWASKLRGCVEGPSTHPVFIALSDTLRRHAIPLGHFEDLLSAFRQDVTKSRYETFGEVLDYCDRSANPVGRIVLGLFGYSDATMVEASDAICTALQLTNFWQDISQDIGRGRLYVPAEDLRQFGVADPSEQDLSDTHALQRLMSFEVERTREYFERGKRLPERVKSPLSLHLRLTWHGGMRVLDKIERSGYTVVRNRPRLGKRDAIVIALRALRAA